VAVCEMLGRNPGKTLADLYRDLPLTFGTPTMSPHCADEVKYGVVEKVVGDFTKMMKDGVVFAGQRLASLVTVNGIRFVAEDGTWGLVRASSNKPEIVVVVESPVSPERRREMFEAVDAVLRRNPEVGAYNQTF
jgi:phosphomannomutase / phosphoglucomutase